MAAAPVLSTCAKSRPAGAFCRPALVSCSAALRVPSASVRSCQGRQQPRLLTQAATVEAPLSAPSMEWFQRTVALPAKPRGCHIVTRCSIPWVQALKAQHRSAAQLTTFWLAGNFSRTCQSSASSSAACATCSSSVRWRALMCACKCWQEALTQPRAGRHLGLSVHQ